MLVWADDGVFYKVEDNVFSNYSFKDFDYVAGEGDRAVVFCLRFAGFFMNWGYSLSPYGHLPAFWSRVFWMIDLVSNSPLESISRRRFEKF